MKIRRTKLSEITEHFRISNGKQSNLMYIMKNNITRSLFAACAILGAISCANEINEPHQTPSAPEQTPGVSDMVFTAAHEGVLITRTSLNSNLIPEWVSGDAIGITSANDANVKCELISVEEGTFSGAAIKGEAPFYAVYPYDADNTFNGSVLTAKIPQIQTVAAGQSVAPGALVAACESESTALEFKNCTALMQIDMPRNDIKSIVIESTGENEYLSGKFTMDLSEENLTPAFIEGDSSLSTSVVLNAAEGALTPGTYYIPVLPTTISGVKLTFTNTADESIVISKSAETILARSNGVTFGTFFTYDISTPEELLKWAKGSAKFTSWDVVNINADIDMSELASEYVEAVNFEGTFNGNNKTITGLTTPLFANLYGSVNNLTINSNINYTGVTDKMPGHNQVVGILAHIAYNSKHSDAKISNVTTKGSITVEMGDFNKYFGVAGLVGSCNGIVVENCENQAAVEVKSLSVIAGEDVENPAANNRILAGGISAQAKGKTTELNNCKNSGSVKIGSDVSTISQSIVAGVTAYSADSEFTYAQCSNSGNVTNSASCATAYFTGGVVGTIGIYGGYNGASSNAWIGTITNCSNSGAVVDNDNCSTAVDHNVGGVVGYACINGITIDGLTNSGTVELSASKSNICSTGGVIGQIRQYRQSTVQNCTNAETATVTIRSECAKLYAGGVFAYKASQTNNENYKVNIKVLDCHNKGNIVNNGTASTDIRIGGIAGQLHYSATFGALNNNVVSNGCSNSGSIISSSAQTASTRIGGIFGQAADILVNVYDSKNTGSISVETTATLSDLYVGGIGGIAGTTPVLDGCSSNCIIAQSGNITKSYGAALIARSSSSKTTIKNCKVAGTVFGIAITADNYNDYLCAYYSNSNPQKVLEGNSFLSE